MKRKKNLAILLSPLVFAVIMIFWMKIRFGSFPVAQIRIDLASLLLVSGTLISTLLLLYFLIKDKLQEIRVQTLASAAKDQRQLLERLDHELKNPVSTIKAGLVLLSLDIGAQEDEFNQVGQLEQEKEKTLQETISKIDSQVLRITHLITDLRKLSDIEIRPLEISQVDLSDLLFQLVDEKKSDPKCLNRTITLTLPTAPWRLPKITADEDLIYLSLFNLLDNAVKYSDCKDTIEVRAFENHHYVDIEIADNGIGIPEDEIDYIWSELYRAKNARAINGNGLGLAIVRRIIIRHHGEIFVRSREGEGTSFSIRLPKKLSNQA